jgi:hypothetical protein
MKCHIITLLLTKIMSILRKNFEVQEEEETYVFAQNPLRKLQSEEKYSCPNIRIGISELISSNSFLSCYRNLAE